MRKLLFEIAYGEYLKKTYPALYQRGIEAAVRTKECHPKSMAAFLYAVGYVEGFISTTEIAEMIGPKTIH